MNDKLLAEWFWTDRWMGSSGFLLPLEARGLYREMLTQAWRRGARLPNDHEAIRRATGTTEPEWRRSWPKVEPYWRVDGDALVNDTQLQIYADAVAAQEKASGRGRKGAQARWGTQPKQCPGDAQASSQALHEECPPSLSPKVLLPSVVVPPKPPAAAPLDGFLTFWDVYPRKKAKADALKAWRKLAPDAALQARMLAAVRLQAGSEAWRKDGGQFVPYPASWLRAGQWDDEPDKRPRGRIAEQDPHVETGVDWFEECTRLHNRACNGRSAHALQLVLDEDRAQRKAVGALAPN